MNLADLFTAAALTAAINKLPHVPGRLESMGIYREKNVTSTEIVIEERNGRLYLVSNTSRDADPQTSRSGKRKRHVFSALHLPDSRVILPSSIQGVVPFAGEEAQEGSAQAAVINDNLLEMKNSLAATREYLRVGGISGKILDADASVIYDLYDIFNVVQKKATIAFSVATTDVKKGCLDAKRHVEKKSAGTVLTGVRALCGSDFFDKLTSHPNVEKAFANYQEAQDRLGGDTRKGFTFGGITFEEYDVEISGQKFIPSDVARVFPAGSGAFVMHNAPANYNDAVNTVGKAYYSKAEERRLGKGWDLEAQSNPLALCMIPEALVELKVG